MHIKKNDTVTVIRGADKGKQGKVLEAFPAEGRVLVEGVNVRSRHLKPKKNGIPGQVVTRAMPMQASNVALSSAKK